MHVLVIHQHVDPHARDKAEEDVLIQAAHVQAALAALGRTSETLAVRVGLSELKKRLTAGGVDIVFNLVESLARSDARIVDVPQLLESLQVKFTGAPARALVASNHKVRAKERMRKVGLPTPDWATHDRGELSPPYIIKALEEHASAGITNKSVIRAPHGTTRQVLADFHGKQHEAFYEGPTFFAEAFIEGREMNVALLAADHGPQVLPPAEIDFSKFKQGRERIVGHKAKWVENSFEYRNTPRVFLDPAREPDLIKQLSDLSLRCWKLFSLRGYARVDFRIDPSGQPWILEVNSNPCLSPDAGFAAALAKANIAWPEAVRRILADI